MKSYFLLQARKLKLCSVSEWFSLMAFLGTADIRVHIAHTSRVIIAFTLESSFILPHTDNTQYVGPNWLQEKRYKKETQKGEGTN